LKVKRNVRVKLLFFLLIVLMSYFVVALNINVISPLSNQNVSGNIILNATTDLINATNVTFMWMDVNGNYVLNVTILNDTTCDTIFDNDSFPTTLLSDGIYNLTVNATNSSGSSVVNTTITLVTIDNTKPNVVSINSPSTGTNYSTSITSSIVLNATVNDTTLTVNTVYFNVSNGTKPFITSPATKSGDYWSINLDLTTLDETTHTITVFANDTVGNFNNSESITITVDNTAPVVTIETINNGNYSTTTPIISFNFTDAQFLKANCVFYVDGSSDISNSSTDNSTSTSLTLSALSQGNHVYYVNCTDNSNNSGVSETYTLTIDSTPPNVVSINNPSTGTNYSSSITSSIVLNATVNDTTLTVNTIYFNVSNGTKPFITSPATKSGDYWNVTLDLTTLDETTHTITVFANDTVGNFNNSKSKSFNCFCNSY
jgi:large repetitive protein